MNAATKSKTQDEDYSAVALSLTACGATLFLIALLRLVLDRCGGAAHDTASSGFCLKVAGGFVTGGWITQHRAVLRMLFQRFARRASACLRPLFHRPAVGILTYLLSGVCFIILVLLGMVSLWSQTIR